jgi:hypothetical protein
VTRRLAIPPAAVEVVAVWPPAVARTPLAALAPAAASSSTASAMFEVPNDRTLEVSCLPKDWTLQDVHDLCSRYGPLDRVECTGPGKFGVIFIQTSLAKKALLELTGHQVADKKGVNYSRVVCMMSDGARTGMLADSVGGKPFEICVDEL